MSEYNDYVTAVNKIFDYLNKRKGLIDGVFGTNLSYLTPELKEREWFHVVDVSKYIVSSVSYINLKKMLVSDPKYSIYSNKNDIDYISKKTQKGEAHEKWLYTKQND